MIDVSIFLCNKPILRMKGYFYLFLFFLFFLSMKVEVGKLRKNLMNWMVHIYKFFFLGKCMNWMGLQVVTRNCKLKSTAPIF